MTPRIRYLTYAEVLFMHAEALAAHGGRPGIMNENGLQSALYRPRQEVFGEQVHPTVESKAAAILESLTMNHPFMDGNKRVAFASAAQFLYQNGVELSISADEVERFMLQVAGGKCGIEEIEAWLMNHSAPLQQ
jgi:death-on-curing protein